MKDEEYFGNKEKLNKIMKRIDKGEIDEEKARLLRGEGKEIIENTKQLLDLGKKKVRIIKINSGEIIEEKIDLG